MVDRSNTTPIGQDRVSQWRNVLFDPYSLKLDLVILCFFDGTFSRFIGTRWLISDISVKWG